MQKDTGHTSPASTAIEADNANGSTQPLHMVEWKAPKPLLQEPKNRQAWLSTPIAITPTATPPGGRAFSCSYAVQPTSLLQSLPVTTSLVQKPPSPRHERSALAAKDLWQIAHGCRDLPRPANTPSSRQIRRMPWRLDRSHPDSLTGTCGSTASLIECIPTRQYARNNPLDSTPVTTHATACP